MLNMEAKQIGEWCSKEIEQLTGTAIERDLISHLLTLSTELSIEEYIACLFGKNKNQCKSFTREYLVRWRSMKEEQKIMAPLKRPTNDELVLFENKKSKNKKKVGKTVPPPGFETSSLSTKTKYVPLISSKGQDRLTVNIPGRHPCQCLGQKHELVNNCLECGRIVCSQEGAGPCLFCGTIVFTRDEEQLLSRDSKRAEKKKEKMWSQYNIKGDNPVLSINTEFNEDLVKATEHKDKLIHFDETSTKRTKVVDDESDYFQVDNQWLTEGQRKSLKQKEQELREAKYGSRVSKGIKVTLDISEREITEEEPKNIDLYSEDHVKGITDDNSTGTRITEGKYHQSAHNSICNTSITVPPPVYIAKKKNQLKNKIKSSTDSNRISRLQDSVLFEMRDEGKCLSMHQPWASLLVYGIKRFEGRTWYTHHRGKLWIASTAKAVEQKDIDELQDQYRQLYSKEDDDIEFPHSYPHGCLLGCIDLIDCLSLEECIEKYPENDSQSPYVFVCENPQELHIKFPIKGKHKIWKLDCDIHQSAKRGLINNIN